MGIGPTPMANSTGKKDQPVGLLPKKSKHPDLEVHKHKKSE